MFSSVKLRLVILFIVLFLLAVVGDSNSVNGSDTTVEITQTNTASFPIIEAQVRVLDSSGNSIANLKKDNFEVVENHSKTGDLQPEDFQLLAVGGGIAPIAVCLVIDTSGSMAHKSRAGKEKITDAKESAKAFVDKMGSSDKIAIVEFNSSDKVRVVQPFTVNKEDLKKAIDSLSAGGNTAFYDGLYRGIKTTIPQAGTKAIIGFTDGLVNDSTQENENTSLAETLQQHKDEVIKEARLTGIPIYTIALFAEEEKKYNSQREVIGVYTPEELQYWEEIMKEIARGTGGMYNQAPDASEIAGIYDKIKGSIQQEYIVSFNSPNLGFDSIKRKVTIIVRHEGKTSNDTFEYTPIGGPIIIQRTQETKDLSLDAQPGNQSINIAAHITKGNQPDPEITGRLLYQTSKSKGEKQLALRKTGNLYQAEIPLEHIVPHWTYYYLTATDGVQTVSDPPKAIDEKGNSYPTYRTIPIFPNYPPEITHTPVQYGEVGRNIKIQAIVTDKTNNVGEVYIMYKRSNLTHYEKLPMNLITSTGENVYQCQIPGSDMTSVGIDYYIVAEDNYKVKMTHPFPTKDKPQDAEDNPQHISSSDDTTVEFVAEIEVENVIDLFGISFNLRYDTNNMNAISAEKGDFLGKDVIFEPFIDHQGTVSIAITRQAPAGGIDGSGVLNRFTFKSKSSSPDGNFEITNIVAIDSNGNSIFPAPRLKVSILLYVWPGDTNNDGKVDSADVSLIRRYWGLTGPARQNGSLKWKGQPAKSWKTKEETFADANGDGIINQEDYLSIGLNLGKTH